MLKKFNILFTLLATISIISTTANSYDVIKDEDEALLKDVFKTEEQIVTQPQNEKSSTAKALSSSINEVYAKDEKNTLQAPEVKIPNNKEDTSLKKELETTPSDITPPTPDAFSNQEEMPPLRSILYPTKEERAQNRQEETEWFNPKVNAPIIPGTISATDALDPYLEYIKTAIHSCMNNKEDKLNIEKNLLNNGNLYQNATYISQTFEEINTCYESIGLDIISLYYENDAWTLNKFKQKAPTFYITGSTPDFDVSHCGDNCSMSVIVTSQIEKFKEYRTYLSELLANRPKPKGNKN